jgi:hypothetical protein
MTQPDKVLLLFQKAIKAAGLSIIRKLSDGRVIVRSGETDVTVSLDNIRRNYQRDNDETAITQFVDTLLIVGPELPDWKVAEARIRFSAEPADHEFGDTVLQAISKVFCRVLVFSSPDERRIRWVSQKQLDRWGTPLEEIEAAASKNMAQLMSATKVQTELVDQHCLAMFATHSAFKASLIFSPNFRHAVEPQIGWPVFAVIPCRDFIYAFPERDRDLIPKLGTVVVREYKSSGYPITTEVLRISDRGIEAIGAFPKE